MNLDKSPVRIEVFDHYPDPLMPRVDVIIVQGRGGPDNEQGQRWFEMSCDSIRKSTYPNRGLITIDNLDRSLSIGQAWNIGVRASSAEFVMLQGDDDLQGPSLLSAMMSAWDYFRKEPHGEHLLMITTGCCAIDEHNRQVGIGYMLQPGGVPIHHTGMYLRNWVAEHGFDEQRRRFVDTEMHDRLKELNKLRGGNVFQALRGVFDYYYRQHAFQVSGQKLVPIALAYPKQTAPPNGAQLRKL